MKPVQRNPYALAAMSRKSGGPMKDRRTPRGGSRNEAMELLDEWLDLKLLELEMDEAIDEDEPEVEDEGGCLDP